MSSNPEMDVELSLNKSRTFTRDAIISSVKDLHEEHGIFLRDIASEILFISSIIFSDSLCGEDSYFSVPMIPCIPKWKEIIADDNVDFLDEVDVEDDEVLAYREFINSDVHKKWKRLEKACNREGIKNEGSDWDFLKLLPEYAEEYAKAFSSFDCEDRGLIYVHGGYINELMMSCIVHGNASRMNFIDKTLKEVQSILGAGVFDLDDFEESYKRYLDDIPVFERIISYIKNNPECQQKNVYKQLGINGKKSWYMFDLAERAKMIKRARYKDTWLLNCI
jgi:hypothetical protein